MKKLKIFLMIGILLCFGFVLSSEVHAQGDGPKPFEVGDILPATTQLRISWDGVVASNFTNTVYKYIKTENAEDSNLILNEYVKSGGEVYRTFVIAGTSVWSNSTGWRSPYTDTNGNHAYIDIDTSEWDLSKRTIIMVDTDIVINALNWEDLNAPSTKKFEIGDVLPAGNIKISWDFTGKPIGENDTFTISSDGDLFIEIWEFGDIELYINYEEFNADTPSYTIITLTEPVTITDVDGTSDYNVYIGNALLWEVMHPEYSNGYDNLYDGERLEIEEGTILPAAKIGINLVFNNTGGPKSGTVVYTFSEPLYEFGQIIFIAQEDNLGAWTTSAEIVVQVNPAPRGWEVYTIDDSLANQSFGSTRGFLSVGILLDFTWATEEERTITDISIVEGDLELDIIFTRILTEEELAYQEGYSKGYKTAREIFGWKDGDNWYNGVDAWNLGEKYARELYGFYDSKTNEWLSVSEYLSLYGTDKPGQSDFYGNFDKYFIPAMIIVFGGAIVLTILKVFKGRE